jgi:hypothetical protein
VSVMPAGDVTIPDVAEPLLGFRVWRFGADERLWPVTRGSPPRQLRAQSRWRQLRDEEERELRALLADPNSWRPGVALEATCERLIWHHLRDEECECRKPTRRNPEIHIDPNCPCVLKDYQETVPDPDCTCGIYATYDLEVVAGYVREAQVLGLVQGWGRAVPGESGFRVRHARITCLFALSEDFTIGHRKLHALADRYGVPLVRPWSELAEDYRQAVRTGRWEGDDR